MKLGNGGAEGRILPSGPDGRPPGARVLNCSVVGNELPPGIGAWGGVAADRDAEAEFVEEIGDPGSGALGVESEDEVVTAGDADPGGVAGSVALPSQAVNTATEIASAEMVAASRATGVRGERLLRGDRIGTP
ncbi:hypothetical protein [Nocardia sp. NPDC047648]|uniref:hypothetical protein n=1 Tax=Nocardia sp. NPDC047648 TaxID=3155625 RepID=UPI0033F1AD8E